MGTGRVAKDIKVVYLPCRVHPRVRGGWANCHLFKFAIHFQFASCLGHPFGTGKNGSA